jgi:sulfite reductase (NADPH) flavoprotein alpha-component
MMQAETKAWPTAATAPAWLLTPDQTADLERLASGLSAEQSIWVSGYLAGIGARARPAVAAAPAAETDERVTVLFASETGNAGRLARQMGEQLSRQGLVNRVIDAADYKPKELKDERFLVLITSTHGEGDPPESAAGFYEFLRGRKAPRLERTRFAVLGLGDSTYEHFCRTAQEAEGRLLELGATPLAARLECDVDFETDAAAWALSVLELLGQEIEAPAADGKITRLVLSGRPTAAPAVHDRADPFPAPVLENLPITGRGSSKETRHIEIGLEGSGLVYEPGDALGVVPQNDPRLVEELIGTLGLDAEEPIAAAGGLPLRRALGEIFEITALTSRSVTGWAATSGASKLRGLLEGGDGAWRGYAEGRQLIDLVTDFPVAGLKGSELVAHLRKLQPRLYSIASSPAANPDEAHLCVSVVRYASRGRERLGVASGWLADRVLPDASLPVYVQANPHFRLPADPGTPIVMIGAGTGIAPYRAFMQEREERGASGKSWLFFGDRNFRSDFLYQLEWQRWLKDGRLGRIDLAFSRDQAEKLYVQHRLLEQGAELYRWLEEGAHLYLCGDSEHLAPDVQAALETVVARGSGVSGEKAALYLKTLQRDGRFQRDVY